MLLPLVIPPLSLDLVGQVSLSSCHIPGTVPRAKKEVNTAGKRMIGVEQQNFVPVSGSSPRGGEDGVSVPSWKA